MQSRGRRPITTLTMVALVLASAALAAPTDGLAQSTMESIRKNGVLKVGYVPYPPTVIKDSRTGKITGHFVDAVEFMASIMKVKVEYVEATWGTFVAGLQSGQFDLSIAATYRTIPRAMAVHFTRPIIYIGNGAIVKKGDTRFKTLEDFNAKGLKIAVAQGEASHEYAKAHFPNAQLIVLSTANLQQPLVEVSAGRADVGLADAWSTRRYAQSQSEVVDLFKEKPYDLTPIGWAVRQGDIDFLQFVNTALDYMDTTGRLIQWESKYESHWLHRKEIYE